MKEEELKKVFKNLAHKPQGDLAQNIWNKIVMSEKHIARVKLYAFSSIGFLSILGFVPVFKALFNEFTQSGFYEYFSLIFSSGNNLFSYWKELMLSLLESLPILNIIFLFSLIFIFLLSMRYVLKQIIKGQLSFSFQV